jgi:hypothetical protein
MLDDETKQDDMPEKDPPKQDPPPKNDLNKGVTCQGEINVIYVGKDRVTDELGEVKLVTTPTDRIPTWRRDGSTEFFLPDGKTQVAGFYHEKAGQLIRAFPSAFKAFVQKG